MGEKRYSPKEKMKVGRSAFLCFQLPDTRSAGLIAAQPFQEIVQMTLPDGGIDRPFIWVSECDEDRKGFRSNRGA